MSPLLQAFLLTFLKIVVITQLLLGLFSLMTLVERRVLAFMQFRLGPNRVGPGGLFQPIADGIKLFFKEEVMPAAATPWAFYAAPLVALTAAFTAIATVPYGPPLTFRGVSFTPQIVDLDIGLLFIFAVTALGVYSVVLAGWSANSKYSLLGGLRSSAQMFSYELALGMSFVGVIMLAGSFRISDIVASQGGWFWEWNVMPWRQGLAALVYFISAAAEVSRTPFDLPEGETELVAGYHTEYSSMKFALMQMAEYVNMITVSVLTVNLFLGGWNPGLPFLPAGGLFGLVYFALKVLGVLFVFIWLRGTLPRFRYDQLMRFGWKVLIPLAALNVLLTAAFVALWNR